MLGFKRKEENLSVEAEADSIAVLLDVPKERKVSEKKVKKNTKTKETGNAKTKVKKSSRKEVISKLLPKDRQFYTVDEINNYYDASRKKKKDIQKKTAKNKRPFFYFLDPVNYATEMKLANTPVSLNTIISKIAILGLAGLGMAYVYKLSVLSTLAIIVIASLFVPAIQVIKSQKKNEHVRLNDLNVYMEQMLYEFKNNQNIRECLMSVRDMYDSDCMVKQAIDEALYDIDNSMSENASEDAFGIIESYYHNDRLASIHKLMLKVEAIGGDCEKSINLLLDDLKKWRNRIETHTQKVNNQIKNILISCIVAMGLCSITVFTMGASLDLTHNFMYQASTVVVAFFLCLIYYKGQSMSNIKWIERNDKYTEEELLQRYEKFMTWDDEAEAKKSRKWALISGIVGATLTLIFSAKFTGSSLEFVSNNAFIGIFLTLALIVLMLHQHKISFSLNNKVLKKEIKKAFPKWLMEIALRMQTDNVQISIIDSLENCPVILKPALKTMVEDIQSNPESLKPYSDFMKDFNLPDVSSAMKMLYAIFSGKGGDSDEQIAELIARNNIMLNQAEILAADDVMGGFYTIFLLPTLVGSLKIVVDMIQVIGLLFSQMAI